jgi:integrase
MPRIAVQLKPAPRGGFVARKAIPRDAADAYGRLFGKGKAQWEAWFNSGPVSFLTAKQRHRDWSNAIEARIANIRAERKGEGRILTAQEARTLAGDWYHWFTARMATNKWSASTWRTYRDEMWKGLDSVVEGPGDPFDHYDKKHVRPIISDEAKTAQFLAAKHFQLDASSRDLFVDFVTRDFFAALDMLTRRAEGDFRDDYAKRFPTKGQGAVDPDLTPWSLFERWIKEAKPAISTIDRWRGVFLKLQADFPNTNAAALLSEQMQDWAKGLINEERAAGTVRDVWVIACRTVFGWAIGANLIARNPFIGWRITVPKKIKTRETKSLTENEMRIILNAAMNIKVHSKTEAAKRWCPWLAAYSGARMGELTQLRGSDVFEQEGIWAIRISPEAGTVKNRTSRTVPLHEHLIEQGFVEFAKASGKGPLFYNEPQGKIENADPTNPGRPRAVKARERLATWVREIGISDSELQPNHAWRHTFKKIGARAGLTEKMLDAICGHAPPSVGRGYGEPDLADKAEALQRFPRLRFDPSN